MDLPQRYSYQSKLRSFFRPGAPINSQSLFSGRQGQVEQIMNATFQAGQHVIMFGERGVGKTSLAKTLADILQGCGVTPLSSGTVNCDGTDDFSRLWHKVFRELQLVVKTSPVGFGKTPDTTQLNLDDLLPEKVTPDDVRAAIVQAVKIAAGPNEMIIILDEVDRITKKNVTTLLADTIKTLSDHLVPVTIILVGVADAVDQMIAEHQSIERSLVQVKMPRMSNAELAEVVDKGLSHAGMTITPGARELIIGLSQGLPHFTHLLSLESANVALNRDSLHVGDADVLVATSTAVEQSQSLLSAHHAATNSPQKNNRFEEVLLACALAPKDELGWFSGSSVIAPLTKIMKKDYSLPYFARHLNEFSSKKRGGILQKYGTIRQHKYRFKNPLMEPFAIIRALSKGMLTEVPMTSFPVSFPSSLVRP